METTTTTSQGRNAAKVAGFVGVIALTATAAVKAKRFVSSRRQARRDRRAAHLTAEA